MTVAEREQEYLRLWLLQDILLILKEDPEQREAYNAMLPELELALLRWVAPG